MRLFKNTNQNNRITVKLTAAQHFFLISGGSHNSKKKLHLINGVYWNVLLSLPSALPPCITLSCPFLSHMLMDAPIHQLSFDAG